MDSTIDYLNGAKKHPPVITKQDARNMATDKVTQIENFEKGKQPVSYDKLTTSRRLRKLLLDREHAIDNYFNHLVDWLITKYSDCEIIIIGYNFAWKTKCDMGKKNNRNFYEIPYAKFLHKLICRAQENNQRVCITEESYTSKCDALAFEKICKHTKYLGNRRGRLFESSTNRYINSDINGAINIMRKWCAKNNIIMTEITGKNIFNPVTIPLSEIMKRDTLYMLS